MKIRILVIAVIFLAGCGGGNGGNRSDRATAGVPTPPSISAIDAQTIQANGPSMPIPFSLGDDQALEQLTLSADVADDSVLLANGITFSSGDRNRALVLAPVDDRIGMTMVTVSVSDADGLSDSSVFLLMVEPEQNVSFADFTRTSFMDDENAPQRNINSREFSQDASDIDLFSSLVF